MTVGILKLPSKFVAEFIYIKLAELACGLHKRGDSPYAKLLYPPSINQIFQLSNPPKDYH
jgi:hypothetical protein